MEVIHKLTKTTWRAASGTAACYTAEERSLNMLSFELTMPNVGSWNGIWTGADKKYFAFRSESKNKEPELDGKNFYYNFGDGWGANIKVEKIDAKERRRREKVSAGFCGYEWMIESILKHGKIQID